MCEACTAFHEMHVPRKCSGRWPAPAPGRYTVLDVGVQWAHAASASIVLKSHVRKAHVRPILSQVPHPGPSAPLFCEEPRQQVRRCHSILRPFSRLRARSLQGYRRIRRPLPCSCLPATNTNGEPRSCINCAVVPPHTRRRLGARQAFSSLQHCARHSDHDPGEHSPTRPNGWVSIRILSFRHSPSLKARVPRLAWTKITSQGP